MKLHVNAGVERRVFVTAQGVDIAPQPHTGGEEPEDHRDDQREDDRYGYPEDAGSEEVYKIEREAIDGVSIGNHQRDAAKNGVSTESDNERM